MWGSTRRLGPISPFDHSTTTSKERPGTKFPTWSHKIIEWGQDGWLWSVLGFVPPRAPGSDQSRLGQAKLTVPRPSADNWDAGVVSDDEDEIPQDVSSPPVCR